MVINNPRELLDYKKAQQFVSNVLGIKTKNAGYRTLYKNTIMLFGNDLQYEKDFYIMPAIKINRSKKILDLYHNRIEIWKLSSQYVSEKDTDPNVLYKEPNDTFPHGRYIFPFSYFKLVYVHGEGLVNENVTTEVPDPFADEKPDPFADKTPQLDPVASNLSPKDFACTLLRYPDSDKEWLNELIRKSNILQGVPNPD